jgi:sirohydrochlorin cobaltochelatase
MARSELDKRAPMAAAPMKYQPDGSVDWGDMWDSFCVLACEGGPPHRGTMLQAQVDADIASAGYRFAVEEICRGIHAVSGLFAAPTSPGWIAAECRSAGMARWLAESIQAENVAAHAEQARLLLPAGDYFTLKGEIKNVITAVAKTTHYWGEHVPDDVKHAFELQAQLERLRSRVLSWVVRRTAR